MNFATINTNKEWHAYYERKRAQLNWRLEQAEAAEWNWPSTRARVQVDKVQRELDQLTAAEFVMPNFDPIDPSCAQEGADLQSV